MSKPRLNGEDPTSPLHYAWVDLKSGGDQWTPGKKPRTFRTMMREGEIGPREFAALVVIVDQTDGCYWLNRAWVQLTMDDWCRMLGGIPRRTARRVRKSLRDKELIVERKPDLIPPPKDDKVHGNVKAVRAQTPTERAQRRHIRAQNLHEPSTNGASEKESTSEGSEESASESNKSNSLSPDDLPPFLDEEWEPPSGGLQSP